MVAGYEAPPKKEFWTEYELQQRSRIESLEYQLEKFQEQQLDIIAFSLYLEERSNDLQDDGFYKMDLGFELEHFEDWNKLKYTEHSGDCTGEPHTCVRCIYESNVKAAKRILKLFK